MEGHQHQDSLDSLDGEASDGSTAVHNEISSNPADSWKVQRAETELRKCLGKKTSETLLKSYSCAWQKDILIAGRMYITPNWFCFYSSILGWETKTKLKFTDVTSISKQKTALVFPNAILIEAGDRKYGFSSVVYRDKVFHVLVTTWRNALSENPLSEAALTYRINDWKKSDHPSTIQSTSFTNSDSESHHTLATNTFEEDIFISSNQEAVDYTPNGRLSSSSEVSAGSNSTESNYTGSNITGSSSNVSIITGTNSSNSCSRSSSSTSQVEDSGVIEPVYNKHKLEWCKHHLSLGAFTFVFSKRCSTTLLINILLIVFIIALLLSTLTMLCRLSHVEPSLQPYLLLQPWCKLC